MQGLQLLLPLLVEILELADTKRITLFEVSKMNIVLKILLITGLLFIAFQNSHADDSEKMSASLQDKAQQSISKGQYVLAPPSPFFSSNITSEKKFSDRADALQIATLEAKTSQSNTSEAAEESPLGSNGLKDRIHDLEMALKDNQEQATNLVEELHATAKNADFENEMYEKTVSLLQEKITTLSDRNKTLTSKLASTESATGSQQSLVSTPKQESAELGELKNSYQQRNEEISSLKKQIVYFEKLREQSSATDPKVQNLSAELSELKSSYQQRSEEVSSLKKQIVYFEELRKQSTVTDPKIQNPSAELSELKSSYQQRNEEVSSLKKQIAYFEELRKQTTVTDVKIKTLEDAYTAKSNDVEELKANLMDLKSSSKALQEKVEGQNTEIVSLKEKISSDEQTQAELIDLQNAATESNDSNVLLKAKNIELDDANKSLKSQLEKMQTHKLGLLDQSSAELEALQTTYLGLLDQSAVELTALKNAYKERNDEASALKEELIEIDNNNISLLSEVGKLKSEASESTKKLGLFDQTTAELIALKSTYTERNDETAALKEKITELDGLNKTLFSKTQQLENDASQNKQKLGLLDQSTTELTALKR